jgi:hypothetical protein
LNKPYLIMKRKTLALAAVVLLVASCGAPGKAEYDTAAQKICDCMTEKSAEAAADTSGLNIDMADLDYSLCVLEAAGDVIPSDPQMGSSISEKCPDLIKVHEHYVKTAK